MGQSQGHIIVRATLILYVIIIARSTVMLVAGREKIAAHKHSGRQQLKEQIAVITCALAHIIVVAVQDLPALTQAQMIVGRAIKYILQSPLFVIMAGIWCVKMNPDGFFSAIIIQILLNNVRVLSALIADGMTHLVLVASTMALLVLGTPNVVRLTAFWIITVRQRYVPQQIIANMLVFITLLALAIHIILH